MENAYTREGEYICLLIKSGIRPIKKVLNINI